MSIAVFKKISRFIIPCVLILSALAISYFRVLDNFELGTLRTIFNLAIRQKYLDENPVRDVGFQKTDDAKQRRFLTDAEIGRLLRACEPEFYSIFFVMILVATMTDFETGLIPDQITLPGMLLGLALSVTGHGHFEQGLWYQKILASTAGLLAGGGILILVGWLGKLVFRKDAMGGGDVKLLAMIGAFVGAPKVVLIFFLAPFPALPLALWQRFVKKEETIPFGPFLALAGVLVFMEGDAVLKFLSNLYGV